MNATPTNARIGRTRIPRGGRKTGSAAAWGRDRRNCSLLSHLFWGSAGVRTQLLGPIALAKLDHHLAFDLTHALA